MENVCQREENLLYFRDQVASSHPNHEMTRETNQSNQINQSKRRLSVDTKSAEQCDENTLR